MKCPKCGYLGFETADRCRNCGYDFSLAIGAAPGSAPDLSLKPASEPQGPLADFKLGHSESAPSVEGRRTFEALDLDRLIGVPGPTSDLLLFPVEEPEKSIDAPMISAPAVPRTPLAVRRSTPEAPRLRTRTGQVEAPELPIGPGPSVSDARASRTAAPQALAVPESAGLARRFAAGAVDTLILCGIDVAVIYFTLRLCDLRLNQFGMLPITPLAAFLLLLNGGYSVAFTSVGGQTIGKMAFGIKVVGEANRPIDISHATLRTLTYLVSWLPMGLGLLPALIGQKRCALHDRVANTQVVQVARS